MDTPRRANAAAPRVSSRLSPQHGSSSDDALAADWAVTSRFLALAAPSDVAVVLSQPPAFPSRMDDPTQGPAAALEQVREPISRADKRSLRPVSSVDALRPSWELDEQALVDAMQRVSIGEAPSRRAEAPDEVAAPLGTEDFWFPEAGVAGTPGRLALAETPAQMDTPGLTWMSNTGAQPSRDDTVATPGRELSFLVGPPTPDSLEPAFRPVYLAEHQVGFSETRIGFPALGDCMGVVLQTTRGLFGFHFTPGDPKQIDAFKEFIDGALKEGESAVHLYGSCRRGRRWPGENETRTRWKLEMEAIADRLDYRGQVSGFDLSSAFHGPADSSGGQSVYLEYHRQPITNDCAIRYKRMDKMAVTRAGRGKSGSDHGIGGRVTPIGPWASGGYRLTDPTTSVTTDVQIEKAKTRSNVGKMHSPHRFAMDSFVRS